MPSIRTWLVAAVAAVAFPACAAAGAWRSHAPWAGPVRSSAPPFVELEAGWPGPAWSVVLPAYPLFRPIVYNRPPVFVIYPIGARTVRRRRIVHRVVHRRHRAVPVCSCRG